MMVQDIWALRYVSRHIAEWRAKIERNEKNVQELILALLDDHPYRYFTIREIMQCSRVSERMTSKILRILEENQEVETSLTKFPTRSLFDGQQVWAHKDTRGMFEHIAPESPDSFYR